MTPSSMRQDFFSGSAIFQPSKDLPSKMLTKPASLSAANADAAVARPMKVLSKSDFMALSGSVARTDFKLNGEPQKSGGVSTLIPRRADGASERRGARHLCRLNVILFIRAKESMTILGEPTLMRTEVRAPMTPTLPRGSASFCCRINDDTRPRHRSP